MGDFLDDLISRRIDLSDINDAYLELKEGGIARSVITTFDAPLMLGAGAAA